jgi:hypothetical protein
MISNTNGLIKWEKTGCNKYTVTNLTTSSVDVEITGETNTFTKTFTIEFAGAAEFEVPSDGVYKICVDGENTTVVVNATETPTETNSYITVYSFVDTGPTAFVLHNDSDGAPVYNESVDGVADTSNPANFTSSLSSYYGATGAELVAPTVVPTNFPWLGADPTNWRVIISVSPAFFTPSGFNYIRVRSAIDGSTTDVTPVLYRTSTFSAYTGTNNWLTNFVIGSISTTNLLALPTSPFLPRYDLSDPVQVDQFKTHAEAYFTFNGDTVYFYQDGSDYTFAILNDTQDVTEFSYSDLTVTTTPIEWCDYLYELCALHTCIISKLRDMLCNECDPCKPCDEETTNKSKKAREDLLYINTLFFNGLVPLITEDRLNYMGDLVIDETRIECTMRIKELFEKLTDFAKRCGECEECEDCDCDCIPNTTTKCNNC